MQGLPGMSPNAMVNQIDGLSNQNFNGEGVNNAMNSINQGNTMSNGAGSIGNSLTVDRNSNSFLPKL